MSEEKNSKVEELNEQAEKVQKDLEQLAEDDGFDATVSIIVGLVSIGVAMFLLA